MAKSTNPDIMSASEVGAFLGLSRNSVYDAAGRGEIPHRRVGRRLLFSRAALVSWLALKDREVPDEFAGIVWGRDGARRIVDR